MLSLFNARSMAFCLRIALVHVQRPVLNKSFVLNGTHISSPLLANDDSRLANQVALPI